MTSEQVFTTIVEAMNVGWIIGIVLGVFWIFIKGRTKKKR